MFETANNLHDMNSLNEEDRIFLERINQYAEQVLGDIDPQKTPISFQLEKLKPIMQEIANEKGQNIEDIFIRYMDLASIASAKKEMSLEEDLGVAGLKSFSN